jgi:hypothetical protein
MMSRDGLHEFTTEFDHWALWEMVGLICAHTIYDWTSYGGGN